jgi:hypothetical protein
LRESIENAGGRRRVARAIGELELVTAPEEIANPQLNAAELRPGAPKPDRAKAAKANRNNALIGFS